MAISKITNDGIGDINELTVDTNTLVVDSTNNRVGIGTTSPSQVLEITNGTSPAYVVQTRGDLQTILGPTGSLVTSAGQVGTITNSPFRFTTNNTERMRIDSSGNVGIGTTAPRTNLHVSGLTGDDDPALGSSVAPFLVTNTANSYGLNIGVNNQGDAWLQAQSNTTSTAYDILLSPLGGNVHIATGGSQAGATVSGTSIRSLDILKSTNTTSGFNQIVFYNPNGAVGTIRTTGSSTAYNTSSDYRLKENVIGITDGIERVKQLNPSRFNFIADADTTVDGFLAHEAQTVVPEAVTGTHNETETIGDITDADSNIVETGVVEPDTLEDGHTWTGTGTQPVYQGIDQAKLVPLLTAALQEAIAKIEALETENSDFEARLTALEAN